MELKSFKNYLKEQNEINEIAPALGALFSFVARKAAVTAATTAAGNLAARATTPRESQPSTVIPQEPAQPAIRERTPAGGQPPSTPIDPTTGTSRIDAVHVGNTRVRNFPGSTNTPINASMFTGRALSLGGR